MHRYWFVRLAGWGVYVEWCRNAERSLVRSTQDPVCGVVRVAEGEWEMWVGPLAVQASRE